MKSRKVNKLLSAYIIPKLIVVSEPDTRGVLHEINYTRRIRRRLQRHGLLNATRYAVANLENQTEENMLNTINYMKDCFSGFIKTKADLELLKF